MVTHVVLIRWKSDIPEGHVERVKEGLEEFSKAVPTIRSYRYGENIGAETNHDFVVIGTFDDKAGWQEYNDHPAHATVRQELLVPYVADVAVLQF